MKLFGLIGFPLDHSYSKTYFLGKFKKEKISEVDYQNFPINNIHELIFLINYHKNLAGINVTSPYKQQVIRFINEFDELAASTDSVNVIKIIREGSIVSLKGYNTDVYGFLTSLTGLDLSNVKSALILGTGGAARAVSYALKQMNINVLFVSRQPESKDTVNYNQLNETIISENKLIINATPLGMFPLIEQKPDIPYIHLTDDHILYDLVYNPPITEFLKEGKNKGASIMNGLSMLENQAEKAWEIFTS